MKNDGGKIVTGYVIDNSQLKAGAEQAKNVFKDVGRTIDSEGNKMDGTVKKLAAGIGAFFSIQQASLFVNKLIDVRSEFQSLQIGLETILGSKEKADKLFREVVDFAAKTPFELKDVGAGVKQLLAYGTQAEDAIEVTRRLGDISAGLSIPLGDLVYLYGTTQVQGKLFTMDLRQFMGRGIPLAEELAKQFGVAKNEVAGLVTAGKVGFADVEKAIKSMTDEGGKFAGLTEKNSQTIKGQMSNLKDTIAEAYNEVGAASEGILYGGVNMASTLVKNYEKVGEALIGLIATYGAYKAAVIVTSLAVNGYTLAEQLLLVKLTIVEKAQKLLNLTMLKNPYVLAAVAITSLVSALIAFHETTNKAQASLKGFNEDLATEKGELNSIFEAYKKANEGTARKEELLQTIKEKYGLYISDLIDEKGKIIDVAEAQERANKALQDNMVLKKMDELKSSANKSYEEVIIEQRADMMKKLTSGKKKMSSFDAGQAVNTVMDIFTNGGADVNKSWRDAKASLGEYADKVSQDLSKIQRAQNNLEASLGDVDEVYGSMLNKGNRLEELVVTAKRKVDVPGGGEGGKPTKGKTALELEQEQQKILSDQERNILEANRRIEDMQFESEQTIISLKEDGYQKRYEQLELDLKRKKVAIDRAQQEELAKLIEQERQKAELEKRSFNPKEVKLPDGTKASYAGSYADADALYYREQKSLLDEVLNQYKDFEQQRADIVKKYADDRFALEKDGSEKSKRALIELSQQEQKALMDFDLMVSGKVSVMSKLFGNLTNLTLEQLQELEKQAEEVFMFLSGGKYTEIQGKLFGISQKDFEEFIKPENLAKFREALGGVHEKINEVKDPIKGITSGFKQMFDPANAGNQQQFIEGLNAVAAGYGKIADAVGLVADVFGNLGELSGSETLKNIGSGLNEALAIGNDVMSGAQTGAAFGPAGAIVGAAAGLIKGVTGLLAKNKKYREELKASIKENQEKEYFGQLEIEAVYRQKYEWAQKIGEVTLQYIKREGEELKKQTQENLDAQGKLWKKISGTQVLAYKYFKETGLFGWGKGENVEQWAGLNYLTLSDKEKAEYFNAIEKRKYQGTTLTKEEQAALDKANGTFKLTEENWKLIEKAASEGKLSKEGQEFYEAMKKAKDEGVDIEKMQIEYLEKLKEIYTGTSYESLVSGIVSAFKQGKRSASDFASSFGDLMKGAVESALELMADEKMRKWYEDWANMGKDGYTEAEIAQAKKDYLLLLENLNTDAAALEKATGISLTDTQSQGAATKGSWQTISSDQGDRLDGRATAILQVNAESLNSLNRLNALSLGISNDIAQMRTVAIDSWSELVSIKKNTALLYETNELLKGVKQGTDRL